MLSEARRVDRKDAREAHEAMIFKDDTVIINPHMNVQGWLMEQHER